MFEGISFIKTAKPHILEYTLDEPAPLFRKKFKVTGNVIKATLNVCGLGCAYYYLNGKSVSKDLLTAPVSNYNKTLWYNTYNVTKLICQGDNIAAVIAGNGFFNETLQTHWNIYKAKWRDNPKFIYSLDVETDLGNFTVVSDDTWKATNNSPVIFNQLRSGEYFDSRLYDESWNKLSFSDDAWEYAVIDKNPPSGVFRQCLCEPVREMEIYKTKTITKTILGSYVFDIGQNISGYIRLKVKEKSGTELTIRYGEQIDINGSVDNRHFEGFYKSGVFHTDKFICNGRKSVWSPKFVYHGFRYIEISGLESEPDFDTASGVFIHQAVDEISEFNCSNDLLNKIFYCGKMSTKSNMHYLPTDCPTREKFGWTNDAQASIEQFLTNFNSVKFLEKWFVDILDSMNEKGAIPCIIPTPGWGYEWGTGPVSDGVLFELPYRLYLHTGNKSHLQNAMPYFKKYLKYIITYSDEKGLPNYGLCDWAGPWEGLQNAPTPRSFTDTVMYIKLLKIAEFSAKLNNCKDDEGEYAKEIERIKKIFYHEFQNADGTSKVNEQTAVSMIIYHDLFEQMEPVKLQLKKIIEKNNFHLHTGMVGMRHLLHALSKCGLHDYAYKIVTSSGYPGYSFWLQKGATTLFECWQCTGSLNHHMYSDILSWFIKNIVGIRPSFDGAAYKIIDIQPIFFDGMEYADGSIKTPLGTVAVSWKRNKNNIKINIIIPKNSTAKVVFNEAFIIENKEETVVLKGGNYTFNLLIKNKSNVDFSV